jgi:hypothetical protein
MDEEHIRQVSPVRLAEKVPRKRGLFLTKAE